MTNLEGISHYLVMEVDVETGKFILRPATYLKKILEGFEMMGCKSLSIPINSGVANSLVLPEQQADQAKMN